MPPAAVAVAVALGLGIAGCGNGDDDFANAPRPPASITLSAAISPGRVTVSPARFGAGPVKLIASNQTSTSQRLTLRSSPIGRPGEVLRQTTGPINPGDTASLQADLRAGNYLVTARTATIDPARITVGPRRPSRTDELLQP
jgi:hypothetical protein